MVNIYQIFGKVLINHEVLLHHNDPFTVIPGNEKDLGHENIVNISLFYQVCKVHDIRLFWRPDYQCRGVMTP